MSYRKDSERVLQNLVNTGYLETKNQSKIIPQNSVQVPPTTQQSEPSASQTKNKKLLDKIENEGQTDEDKLNQYLDADNSSKALGDLSTRGENEDVLFDFMMPEGAEQEEIEA